jgi:hypothetical protein
MQLNGLKTFGIHWRVKYLAVLRPVDGTNVKWEWNFRFVTCLCWVDNWKQLWYCFSNLIIVLATFVSRCPRKFPLPPRAIFHRKFGRGAYFWGYPIKDRGIGPKSWSNVGVSKWEMRSESLHESFLNSRAPGKREQEFHGSWLDITARVAKTQTVQSWWGSTRVSGQTRARVATLVFFSLWPEL